MDEVLEWGSPPHVPPRQGGFEVLQCYKGLFTGVISWFYEVLHFLLKCYIFSNAEWRGRGCRPLTTDMPGQTTDY